MKIPKLEAFSPTLVDLRAKFAELNAASLDKKAKCQRLRANIQANDANPGNDQFNRARQLLGEQGSPTETDDRTELQRELRALDDLAVAINMAREQINLETRAASVKLCNSLGAEHDLTLAKTFIASVLALHQADAAYSQFFHDIESAGASSSSIARLYPTWLGNAFDNANSGYSHWLHEALHAGLLNKMPDAFQ